MEYIVDISNLEENMPFKASFKGIPIVLYKTAKGIFAVEDTCSHEYYHLSESTAEDGKVECKKHGSVFDLQTGKALILPAVQPIKTYKVIIEDQRVFVSDYA